MRIKDNIQEDLEMKFEPTTISYLKHKFKRKDEITGEVIEIEMKKDEFISSL